MKIKLNKTFKSLEPFESEGLSDFVVITGKNGSGKSQLIQLISDYKNVANEFELLPKPNHIQIEGVEINKQSIVNHDNWRLIVQAQWNYFTGLNNEQRKVLAYLFDNAIFSSEDLQNSSIDQSVDEFEKMFDKLRKQILPSPQNDVRYKKLMMAQNLNLGDGTNPKFIHQVASYSGKEINDLQQIDFYRTPMEEHFIDKSDLFSSEIAMVFYNYVKRWDQNSRDFYDRKVNKKSNLSMSEDEFLKRYPKPWETINKIISDHKLDFAFIELDRTEFHQDVPVNIQLKKISSGKTIAFQDLSSGEKIIIALIIKLFTSEYYGKHLKFPELLVLDEPDATLHPEMSKLLLDVLEQTFVKKFGIKVIITTHSPSTVALAPDDTIYQLKNGAESSLKRIDKDEALTLLTNFIPTLSIGYKNQRQVFVESPTDVAYFQMLHDKLLQEEKKDYRLYFISNAVGSGNSTLVYDLVKAMRNAGNKTIFGIVDWDLKNVPIGSVYVHGANSRYSIENFILDPIYIMMLFASMGKGAFDVFNKIGKDTSYNQYNLGAETEENLQKIVEIYFGDFEKAFPDIRKDEVKIEVKYYNGKTLWFPVWYLKMKGHDIVTKLSKVYPGIEEKFRSEGEIQRALVTIMGKSFPFVSLESVELITKIGNS